MRITSSCFKARNEESIEYEFSTKSVHNTLYALSKRHLSAGTATDESHVNRFSDMCDKFYDHVFSNFKIDDEDILSIYQFVDMKKQFSNAKKRKYIETMHRQIKKGPFRSNLIGSFKTMVKSGEIFSAKTLQIDNLGFIQNCEERPRNICMP